MIRGHRTVAVAAIGDPLDPGLWSGTPSNIARGLESLGFQVIGVDVTPPANRIIVDLVAAPRVLAGIPKSGLRPSMARERRSATQSMLYSWACSRRGRTILSGLRGVDGVVQMGTGYIIEHPNTVSYEDMTIPQAVAWPETFWGDVPRSVRRRRIRLQSSAYQRLKAATFATDWAAQSAVNDQKCPPEKAHVVGIGLNHSLQTSPMRDWSVPRFLFAARAWEAKGGPDVLAAFAEVKKAYPAAELHLVGRHPEVDEPGVVGHGYQDLRDPEDRAFMAELWGTATCCVVPSRYEAAGIIYVEAMAAGIPSIGTTQGGARNVIGDAGAVVDPGDVEALTGRMLEYCDPGTASRLGATGRSRSTMFTWESVARGLADALSLPVGQNTDDIGRAEGP